MAKVFKKFMKLTVVFIVFALLVTFGFAQGIGQALAAGTALPIVV